MSIEGEMKAKIEGLRILVVDDDAMVRTIILEYLKVFGFKDVIECKDGSSALKKVRDRHTRIDLVISDWEMPRVNGITLLKAVRSEPVREKTKFIMVTSQISQERFKISRAKQSSVDGYIVKPFRGEVLREKIFVALGWLNEKAA